ncbi:MAG: PDZ domain-containing protein, partial [Clostridia bacterium]|nr:PDZ domain-containing protein [Clostridia bacterium]
MKKIKSTAALLLAVTVFTSVFSVSAKAEAADGKTDIEYNEEICTEVLSDNVQISSRLWELLFGAKDEKSVVLCPGGDVFGVKIKQNGVTVTEAKGIPALKPGDVILSINNKSVSSSAEIREILAKSGGESVTVRALHSGNEISLEVRPTLVDGEYRLGLTLRDGAAGIGTVTFVDPETGIFGGLGHGICDGETGEIVSMESGEICDVILGGVHRGESG